MRAHLRDVSSSRRIYCTKFLRIYQPTGKMRLVREISCNNCGRESIDARDDRWHSTWDDARPRRLAPFLKLGSGDLRKRGVGLRKGAILRFGRCGEERRAGAEKAMVPAPRGAPPRARRRRGTVAVTRPAPPAPAVCPAGSASLPRTGIPARIDRLCKGARRGFTCATALSRMTSRCLPTTRRP